MGRFGWLTWIATCVALATVACAEPDSPAFPQPDKEVAHALRDIERALTLELHANEATALNRGSYEETIRKALRQEQALGVLHRIPLSREHSPEGFVTQLLTSALKAGVVIRNVQIEARPIERRKLPEVTSSVFHWQPDDLRDTWDVRFRLEALSAAGLRRWFARLPSAMPRLMVLQTLVELPGGWDVTAEIYGFAELSHVPRHEPKASTLGPLLEERGVRSEALYAPALVGALARCRELEHRIAAGLEGVRAALLPLARSHMLTARWRLFTDRVSAAKRHSPNKLLGLPEEPGRGHGHHEH